MVLQYVMTDELNALIQEFASLRFKHYQFEALIGRDNENVELLNASAPSFFHMVHNVLWADILMHVTRITGPASTRVGRLVKKNLSIQRFLDSENPRFTAEGEERIKHAVKAAEFAKDARNRVFAHTDLDVALRINDGEVTLGSREMLAEAIDAIATAIGAFFPIPIQKDYSSQAGGAVDLIARLQLVHDKQESKD